MVSKNEFRLDRTAFEAMTLQQADNNNDYKNKSLVERFRIAAYLNSVAYNYSIDNPPKMDKTIFKARNLINGY